MNKKARLDLHGVSRRAATHSENHDHYAIASLSKTMRLHKSNLSLDDDSRVHGQRQGHLFLVADGISGAPAPAQASGAAVDSVVAYFLNEMPWYHLADGEPQDVMLALEDALSNAQEELRRGARPSRFGMGTTMTLAFVFWPDLYVAHVGDSRCYLGRMSELFQLTTDHTLARVRQELGGTASPGDRNTLWNALGGRDSSVHAEVRHLTLELGDVLLLVTDGVTAARTKPELESVVTQAESAEEICQGLLDSRARDDQTAVAVRFVPQEGSRTALASATPWPPLTATSVEPESLEGPDQPDQPGRKGSPVRPKRPQPPKPPKPPKRRPCSAVAARAGGGWTRAEA